MPKESFLLDQFSALPPREVGLAVLGYPIKHSISPQLHNAALKVLAEKEPEFNNWKYHKIEVHPENLSDALPKLAELGFRGLNLTIPHKVEVLPMLSSMDEQARAMGAVNTLNWEEGGWKGYNTDGIGLSRSVREVFDRSVKEFQVLVLGAGGAARAAVAQCLFEGCENLAIFNRSMERAYQLSSALKENGFEQKISLVKSLSHFPHNAEQPVLVINATSLGLAMDDPAPIDLSCLKGEVFVYDMVYNPPDTRLLMQAKEKRFPHANGLGMLVGQAARSLEIWSEREVSIHAMSCAALQAMSD